MSYSVVGIYLSFQAVVLARLLASWRGWRPEAAGFNLGRASLPVAILALFYGCTMIVNLCWPRPADAIGGWLTPIAALSIVVPGLAWLALGNPRAARPSG